MLGLEVSRAAAWLRTTPTMAKRRARYFMAGPSQGSARGGISRGHSGGSRSRCKTFYAGIAARACLPMNRCCEPPGFGLRQPSGAFRWPRAFESGRGLPQSKTLTRVSRSSAPMRDFELVESFHEPAGSWSQCAVIKPWRLPMNRTCVAQFFNLPYCRFTTCNALEDAALWSGRAPSRLLVGIQQTASLRYGTAAHAPNARPKLEVETSDEPPFPPPGLESIMNVRTSAVPQVAICVGERFLYNARVTIP
jgi:hypothetical protein